MKRLLTFLAFLLCGLLHAQEDKPSREKLIEKNNIEFRDNYRNVYRMKTLYEQMIEYADSARRVAQEARNAVPDSGNLNEIRSQLITGDSIIDESGTLVKNRTYTSLITTATNQTLTLPAITKDDIGKRIEISNEYTGSGVFKIVDDNGITHRGFRIEKYTLSDNEEVKFIVVVDGSVARWRMAAFVPVPERIEADDYTTEDALKSKHYRRIGSADSVDNVMVFPIKLKAPAGANLVDRSNFRSQANPFVDGVKLLTVEQNGTWEYPYTTEPGGSRIRHRSYLRDTLFPQKYTLYVEARVGVSSSPNATVEMFVNGPGSDLETSPVPISSEWKTIRVVGEQLTEIYSSVNAFVVDFQNLNDGDTVWVRKPMVAPGENVEYTATEADVNADAIFQFGEYNPVNRVVDLSEINAPYKDSYILQSAIDWAWRTNKANAFKLRPGMRITEQITYRDGMRFFFESRQRKSDSWSYQNEDYLIIDLNDSTKDAFVPNGTPYQDQNLTNKSTSGATFENISFYVVSSARDIINADGTYYNSVINCEFFGNDLARNAIRAQLRDGVSDLALRLILEHNYIQGFVSAGIVGGGPAWRIIGNTVMKSGSGIRITGTYSGAEYRGQWLEDLDSVALDVTGGNYFSAYDCYYENNGIVSGDPHVKIKGVTNVILQGGYYNSNPNRYNIQLDSNYAVTLIGVRYVQGKPHNWTPDNRKATAKCFTSIAMTAKGEGDIRDPDIMSCLDLNGNDIYNSTLSNNYFHDSIISSKIYLGTYGENILLNSSELKTTDGSNANFKWTVDSIEGVTGDTDAEVYEATADITGGTTTFNGNFTLGDTVIPTEDYIFSFYKKDLDTVGTRTFTLTIGFDGDASTYITKATDHSDGWTRYTIPINSDVGYSAGTAFNIRFGQLDQGDVFALDGFQLQKGTRLSTYIKTGAAKGLQENVEFVSDNPVEFTGGLLAPDQPQTSAGTGAPATTPSQVGQFYVDTSSGVAYIATGTSSAADWKQITN